MRPESLNPLEGAFYAVQGTSDHSEASYHVIKVLKVDNEGVHIRQYRDRFTVVPEHSSVQSLDVAMGHLPLSYAAFARMDPDLLQKGEVSEEELEGYRYWQEEGGGYFA